MEASPRRPAYCSGPTTFEYYEGMRNHAHSHGAHPSRRDFFHTMLRSSLGGASILELAHYRAAWARGMAPTADTQLFDIRKVADGVFCAQARAQSQINSNS